MLFQVLEKRVENDLLFIFFSAENAGNFSAAFVVRNETKFASNGCRKRTGFPAVDTLMANFNMRVTTPGLLLYRNVFKKV